MNPHLSLSLLPTTPLAWILEGLFEQMASFKGTQTRLVRYVWELRVYKETFRCGPHDANLG